MDSFAKSRNKLLPQDVIGFRLIELQQVDSTNNYATALAHAGMAQHGCVVWAHHQTTGKGQRSKSWEAAVGENITASFIIDPSALSLSRAFGLSMAVAIAVQRFFSAYAGAQTKVKWPNDLYWGDRKAGGILIENSLSGSDWRLAVIGIGININQTAFGEMSSRAVSLKQLTGKTYVIRDLIPALAAQVQQAFTELLSDSAGIENAYHQMLYKRGERVRLKKGGRVFEALIKGVTSGGQLVAHHITDETFDVGEVEWLFNPPS
ncbi:MAG: hypothetical protein JWP88_2158 [Flaviaesturariibacter sp.]|nr:hypothetical protein [Flaviaesturariibacter sp.]